MKQDVNNSYKWPMHERILLGLASTLGWFPLIWIVAGQGLVSFSLSHEVVFWSYIGISVVLHITIFGIFAFFFSKIYIAPAWLLNFMALVFYVKQIVTSLVSPFEPDYIAYSESGYNQYHIFSMQNVYLAILALFFLMALYRPAMFHVRKIIRR